MNARTASARNLGIDKALQFGKLEDWKAAIAEREESEQKRQSKTGATGMTQTITATFEDGVLKPAQPLDLPEHAQVHITIELPKSEVQKQWEAQKEQRLAALAELWKNTRPHSEHLTRDQLHERR